MKRLFILLFIPFLLYSCIGPEGEEEPEVIDMSDIYHFKYIDYSYEEGDYIRETVIPHAYTIHKNYTDEQVFVPFRWYPDAQDYSVFHGLESKTHKLYKDKSTKVYVPSSIEEDNIVYISTYLCNLYEEEYYPSFVSEIETINKIDPKSGLDIEYNEVIREMKVTFTAWFVGEKYGREIEIKGSWEGKKILDGNTTGYIHYDLDPSEPH